MARPSWKQRIASMLGVSAYQPPPPDGSLRLDSEVIEQIRRTMGGILQQIPVTRLRWYLADLEQAQAEADAGYLQMAAQLFRAMQRDGTFAGLLSSRTSGLVRLPKRFYGANTQLIDDLRAYNGSRSVFDEMCPPSELAALSADGDMLGVGVAELVPVEGRDYPVLIRLDPEWLQYVWQQNRWYYLSRAGRLPITPGDGRWVLHIPNGRIAPWRWGLWPACGRSFINKEHAILTRAGLIASIANPARVIESPQGASQQERKAFFKHMVGWGPNMVIELPVGWQAKILEMTGRSYDVFQQEIDTSDREFRISLTGQEVTTTGGTGFSNQDVPREIRRDILKASAEGLAYTTNTQILPQFIVRRYGVDGLDAGTSVEWDTEMPQDQQKVAQTLLTFAQALVQFRDALAESGKAINVTALASRYGIPLEGGDASEVGDQPRREAAPMLEPAPANGEETRVTALARSRSVMGEAIRSLPHR